MREFSAAELQGHLAQARPSPLLLDVRQPWEYELCRIDGSRLIPMGEIPARIDELDSQQQTVVICHHGIRSRQVAYYLERAGFEDVINLRGGVNDWARQVDLDMATY